MSKLMQHSFASGELAPAMFGRIDLQKFDAGVKLARNFYPLPHGPLQYRPGFEYIHEVQDSARRTRVVPFAFSTVQTYVIELGHLRMRFYKDGGLILLSSAPAAWSALTTYEAGDLVASGGTNYICVLGHLNHAPPNATYWHPLTGDIAEIPAPWTEDEIFDLKYTQSADVMTFAHPAHDMMELARLAHDQWTLTAFTTDILQDAPTSLSITAPTGETNHDLEYHVTAVNAETGEESLALVGVVLDKKPENVATGAVRLSWTAAAGAGTYNIYRSDIYHDAGGSPGFIGRTHTTEFVDLNYVPVQTDTPPSARDPFSGTGNKPGAVTYHAQRLVTGGSDNKINGYEASQIGSFHNFGISEPVRDDDAISGVLTALEVNRIRHFVPLKNLIIFTVGGIFSLVPNDSRALTPSSGNEQHSAGGVSNVRPLVVDDGVLYIEESGSKVRDLGFSLESEGYKGFDRSILAEHLFQQRSIVDWCYARYPDTVVWAARDDGNLLSLTYIKEHDVYGWAKHDTDGKFESCCAVQEGQESAVYAVIRRRIDGAYVRNVERMRSRLFRSIEDAFFVDSGLTLDIPKAITGATQANPVVITAVAHGFVNGDLVDIDETVEGMIELFGTVDELHKDSQGETFSKQYKVANKTNDTFELQTVDGVNIDGTGFSEYLGGGNARKAVTAITGLDHLEGKTVSVLANGNVDGPFEVTAGAITLTDPASRVHVGLPYVGDAETLALDITRTLAGSIKKIIETKMRMVRSRGIQIGPDTEHLHPVKWRTDEAYNEPTRLITGNKNAIVSQDFNDHGRLWIRQSDPLPFTLVALIHEIEVGRAGGG